MTSHMGEKGGSTFDDELRAMRRIDPRTADEMAAFLNTAFSVLAAFDRRTLVDCSEALDHLQEACDAMAAAPVLDPDDLAREHAAMWREEDRRTA